MSCSRWFFTRRSPVKTVASTAKDVIAQLTEKLIRRHPYVFAGEPLPEDAASVLKQRMQIKASENDDGEAKSALGNVPKAMPALARAQSISRRAAHLGFEWPDIEPVWGKVEEEIRELKEAAASGDKVRTGEEVRRPALYHGQYRALSRCRSRRGAGPDRRPLHAPLSSHRNQAATSEQEFRSIIA